MSIIAPFSFLNTTKKSWAPLVIVGTNFAAVSNDLGDTWSASTIPSGDWNKVCSGFVTHSVLGSIPIFVAVGDSNLCAISVDGGNTFVSNSMPTGNWVDVSQHGLASDRFIAVRSNNGRQYATGLWDTMTDSLTWSTANMPAITISSGVAMYSEFTTISRGISRGEGGHGVVAAFLSHYNNKSGPPIQTNSVNSGIVTTFDNTPSFTKRNVGITLTAKSASGARYHRADCRHVAVSQRIGGTASDTDSLAVFRQSTGADNNTSGRILASDNNSVSWSNLGAPNRNYDRIAMSRGQIDGKLKAVAMTSNSTDWVVLEKADAISSWVLTDRTPAISGVWEDICTGARNDNINEVDFFAINSTSTFKFARMDNKVANTWASVPNVLIDTNVPKGIAYGDGY